MKETNYLITIKSKQSKFSRVESLVNMVLRKETPSLLLCGQAGIGKTRLVLNCLKANFMLENIDYKIIKGHSTSLGLYKLLYMNKRSTLIFDDCDNVFCDKTGISILKAALDSYDKRTVSWQSPRGAASAKVPESFMFEGSIIFISNLFTKDIDSAVLSRSFHCDLILTPQEILATMYFLLDKIELETNLEDKKMVFKAIEQRMPELVEAGVFNLRALIKGIRLKAAGIENWETLIEWI